MFETLGGAAAAGAMSAECFATMSSIVLRYTMMEIIASSAAFGQPFAFQERDQPRGPARGVLRGLLESVTFLALVVVHDAGESSSDLMETEDTSHRPRCRANQWTGSSAERLPRTSLTKISIRWCFDTLFQPVGSQQLCQLEQPRGFARLRSRAVRTRQEAKKKCLAPSLSLTGATQTPAQRAWVSIDANTT